MHRDGNIHLCFMKHQLLGVFREFKPMQRTLSCLTKGGAKTKASKLLEEVVRTTKSPISFANAIAHCEPVVELRSVRVSRMTRQIPIGISNHRQQGVAIRWLVQAARRKKKKSSIDFSTLLTQQFQEAAMYKGDPVTQRNELHKVAYSNRVFAKARWW